MAPVTSRPLGVSGPSNSTASRKISGLALTAIPSAGRTPLSTSAVTALKPGRAQQGIGEQRAGQVEDDDHSRLAQGGWEDAGRQRRARAGITEACMPW
jgi:hypothetical protein